MSNLIVPNIFVANIKKILTYIFLYLYTNLITMHATVKKRYELLSRTSFSSGYAIPIGIPGDIKLIEGS